MYYFSNEFLEGLQTKSEGFQNKFYEIIDNINGYIVGEEKKKEFQELIEKKHSYSSTGNILYSTKKHISNFSSPEEVDKKIHSFVMNLFNSFDAGEIISQVPHIIVCVSAPESHYDSFDLEVLEAEITLERIIGDYPDFDTSVFLKNTDEEISCYVACLK